MAANDTVNFLSYNSTGLDTVKTEFIRDLGKVTNSSFIGLQEHFRKSKTINNFFTSEFPSHYTYIIPGFRESGQDKGRPKGGLCQLVSKDIFVKKKRIVTNNYRVQAQVLDFPSTKIMWINSYFPTHPGTINIDDLEFLELLHNIESCLLYTSPSPRDS